MKTILMLIEHNVRTPLFKCSRCARMLSGFLTCCPDCEPM